MALSYPGRALSWWVAWILVCVPAGAAAGWGTVEFLLRTPGAYDGGFAGDLILFGGMMALVQAPFIGVFGRFTTRTRGLSAGLSATALVMVWVLVGFVGWTLGSIVEVWLDLPYRSGPSLYDVFGRSVRWFVMGILQGIVFAACFFDSMRGETRAVGSRTLFSALILAWALASAVGGFFFETWSAFDSVYAVGSLLGTGDALSGIARDLGAAPNVADYIVPYAVVLPLLYGPFTGAVIFFSVRRM